MENAMTDLRDIVEATRFRRTPEGIVFQGPKPRMFGPPDHYLVSEAQKDELLRILAPSWSKIGLIAAAIVAWTAAAAGLAWAFGSGHDDPTAGDLVAMMVLIFAPIVVAIVLAGRLMRRRTRAVLADAPLTSQRITLQEQRAAMARPASVRQSLRNAALSTFSMACLVFSLVLRARHHPLFGDAVSITLLVSAILMAFTMVLHYVTAIVSILRARRPPVDA
jgi:hypothetical protein